MIKLNNKNITYIALADTNNSLKAPKEIWYADSSNSVKLVYRRKDALIEGEDYEKYHWLKGDGNTYIDTLVSDLTNVDAVICYFSAKGVLADNRMFGREMSGSWFTVGVDMNNSSRLSVWIGNSLQYPSIDTNEDFIEIDLINNIASTSLQSYNFNAPASIGRTFYLFGNNGYNIPFVGKIKQFTIGNTLNLIPCKLLKPVPKWLDANGIRRQVGECGMIDLVSGKFYGNVNSVGTFTVENYYERKEWLQGRNGAYIDTNYYPIVGTDVFSVHFHYDGTMKNPDGIEQDAFGVNYKDSNENNFIRAFINSNNYLSCSYYKYIGVWPTTYSHSEDWNIDDLLINGSKFQYSANEVSYSFDNNNIQLQVCPYSLFVFKNNDQVFNQNCYLHGDISSFKITDTSSNTKMNLIPCTLTMDLPASMDANNIARTKGTSGMWDLVSDRFYGNVASSGTFKAVNLAEGVDYEVHDWLYTELPEKNSFMFLPIGSDTFSFNRVFYKTNGVVFFSTNGYLYYSSQQRIRLWDINSRRMLFNSSQYQYGELIQVISDSNSDSVTIKDSSIPKYAYDDLDSIVVDFREAYTDGNFASKFKTSKIIVDGIERYIPVKLLRSIPSKYDANGIARQVGECGMYDTINDVFYGNVASSGSFTVEDDN